MGMGMNHSEWGIGRGLKKRFPLLSTLDMDVCTHCAKHSSTFACSGGQTKTPVGRCADTFNTCRPIVDISDCLEIIATV